MNKSLPIRIKTSLGHRVYICVLFIPALEMSSEYINVLGAIIPIH